jgi:hypothetical protein
VAGDAVREVAGQRFELRPGGGIKLVCGDLLRYPQAGPAVTLT